MPKSPRQAISRKTSSNPPPSTDGLDGLHYIAGQAGQAGFRPSAYERSSASLSRRSGVTRPINPFQRKRGCDLKQRQRSPSTTTDSDMSPENSPFSFTPPASIATSDTPSNLDTSSDALAIASADIFDALEVLRQQFSVETLLVITRGNVRQQRFARVHASHKTACFLNNVIRTDAGHLAEKLEGYVVSGAADHGGIVPLTAKMKQKEQIKIARDYILNALTDILREEQMSEDQIPKSMNYKSYETKIVAQCGVVLVGYPGDKGIVNPGELDALTLKELLSRLNDGRCRWEKLSGSELNQRRQTTSHPQSPTSSDGSTSHTQTTPSSDESTSHTQSPNPSDRSMSQTQSPDASPSASFSDIAAKDETGSDDEDCTVNGGYEGKTMRSRLSEPGSTRHCDPPPYPSPDPGLWQTMDPVSRAMQILLGNYRAYADAFTSILPSHALAFSPEARSHPQTAPLFDGTSTDLLSMFLSPANFYQNASCNPLESYATSPSSQAISPQILGMGSTGPERTLSSAGFSRDGSNTSIFSNLEFEGSSFWPYVGEDLS